MNIPSRYWEPGAEEEVVLPKEDWIFDGIELPFGEDDFEWQLQECLNGRR